MGMESSLSKVRLHLDTIIAFLNPLLPLANCHMVEFFTQNHWDRFIPDSLRASLDNQGLNEAVDKFWCSAEGLKFDSNCELSNWIKTAKSHCVTINNDYCISKEQLQSHITSWGGEIKTEIKVKEFMNSKKSYEVQTMSHLVASLHSAYPTTYCVEAGGGRGHLPLALSLGYAVPSLTIDCDEKTVNSAVERVKLIQKQWHAIAKNAKDGSDARVVSSATGSLHRFASAFVTKHTDLTAIVRTKFPEHSNEEIELLLTGLHTCGNLGPDSLRIFSSQASTAAVFNVPCCYHLLTESADVGLFDVFQKDYGHGHEPSEGFPMSEHLRGYSIGRNARMLAAQSLDRVVRMRQWPAKSLLYRALLQVIVKKHLPDFPLSDGRLKRVKCQTFVEYFKMADDILQLELFSKLSSEYLDDFCNGVDLQWKKIVLFYLLRLCLAQVIESVILLDRLLYLYENRFQKVFLVKLFDPVLSPRCHSIVAVR